MNEPGPTEEKADHMSETRPLTVADLSPGNSTLNMRFQARHSSEQFEASGFYIGTVEHPDQGVLILITGPDLDGPFLAVPVNNVIWCRTPVRPYVEVDLAQSGGRADDV